MPKLLIYASGVISLGNPLNGVFRLILSASIVLEGAWEAPPHIVPVHFRRNVPVHFRERDRAPAYGYLQSITFCEEPHKLAQIGGM